MDLVGGPPILIYEGPVAGRVTWDRDNRLYFFEQGSSELRRIPADGGSPETVLSLTPMSSQSRFTDARVLPDGRGALIMERAEGVSRIHLVDLETGQGRDTLAAVDARYSPSGHRLFVTEEGSLMAAAFDQRRLEFTSRPVALLQGIEIRFQGYTDLSIADAGVMAYTTVGINVPERVVWVGRDGNTTPVDADWTRETEFEAVDIAPDGSRLALQVFAADRDDIWIKQLDQGPLTRLTFEGLENLFPSWTPDGSRVAYVSHRSGEGSQVGVWTKHAEGSGNEELVIELDRPIILATWSASGDWLVLSVGGSGVADDILGFRPGVDSVPVPLVVSSSEDFQPTVSGDDQWLAYVSDESGRREIWIRPFPETQSARWQLSTDGGMEPRWSTDGRTLYYRSLDGQQIRVVDLSNGPSRALPRPSISLPDDKDYEVNPRNWLFDVAADGRFVMVERAGGGDVSGDLILVQNFFRELDEKVGR